MPIDTANFLNSNFAPSRQMDQSSIYSDLNSLDEIRKMGLNDEVGAIKKAAKEFEAFFMNMMLKSMRQASEVIGEDSLMGSQQEKMYTSMMDEQMSVDLSQKGFLGIADLMTAQLTRSGKTDVAPRFAPDASSGKASKLVKTGGQIIQPKSSTDPTIFSGNLSRVDIISERHLEKGLQDIPLLIKGKIAAQLKPGVLNTGKSTILSGNEKGNIVSSSQFVEPTLIKQPPAKKALFTQVSKFIETLLPLAKSAAKKLDVDPKMLIAQAALETGWGKFIMHDENGKPGFNLFGIKAGEDWQGKSIQIKTLEVEQQQFKQVTANFRKYASFNESFEDYVNFVKQNPRYQKALDVSNNATNYIKELQHSGYATDPDYATKILKIFNDKIGGSVGFGME